MKLKPGEQIDAEFVARLQLEGKCVNIDGVIDEMKANARYKKPEKEEAEDEYERIAKNAAS